MFKKGLLTIIVLSLWLMAPIATKAGYYGVEFFNCPVGYVYVGGKCVISAEYLSPSLQGYDQMCMTDKDCNSDLACVKNVCTVTLTRLPYPFLPADKNGTNYIHTKDGQFCNKSNDDARGSCGQGKCCVTTSEMKNYTGSASNYNLLLSALGKPGYPAYGANGYCLACSTCKDNYDCNDRFDYGKTTWTAECIKGVCVNCQQNRACSANKKVVCEYTTGLDGPISSYKTCGKIGKTDCIDVRTTVKCKAKTFCTIDKKTLTPKCETEAQMKNKTKDYSFCGQDPKAIPFNGLTYKGNLLDYKFNRSKYSCLSTLNVPKGKKLICMNATLDKQFAPVNDLYACKAGTGCCRLVIDLGNLGNNPTGPVGPGNGSMLNPSSVSVNKDIYEVTLNNLNNQLKALKENVADLDNQINGVMKNLTTLQLQEFSK